jgi:hypothetical protein
MFERTSDHFSSLPEFQARIQNSKDGSEQDLAVVRAGRRVVVDPETGEPVKTAADYRKTQLVDVLVDLFRQPFEQRSPYHVQRRASRLLGYLPEKTQRFVLDWENQRT